MSSYVPEKSLEVYSSMLFLKRIVVHIVVKTKEKTKDTHNTTQNMEDLLATV